MPFDLLGHPNRFLFFTGKGGVGKTSLSCAVALALADRGARVLLVSTDPASNLDEMLEVALTDRPKPVPDAAGLFALNIDPDKAAEDYRARVSTRWGQRRPTRTAPPCASSCRGPARSRSRPSTSSWGFWRVTPRDFTM